jgi:hypothetical protein
MNNSSSSFTGFQNVPFGQVVTTPLSGLDPSSVHPENDYALSSTFALVTIIVSALVYGLGFLAVAYAWWFRNYPPLKAKHIPLLTMALIANALWWLGFLHAFGFFGFSSPITQQCAAWDVWLQFIFGIMLLALVYNFRLFSLYKVFVKRQSVSSTISHFLIPALLFMIPTITVGFLSLVVPEWTIMYVGGACRMHVVFKVVMYVLAFIALVTLGWLTFALRNIRRSFNEFAELRLGFYVALVAITFNTVITVTESFNTVTMVLLVLTNIVAGNLYVWIVLWQPLFGHMFHREHTLRRFILDLDLDGVKNASIARSMLQGKQSSSKEKSGMPELHISEPVTPDERFITEALEHQMNQSLSPASANRSISKMAHMSSANNSYFSDLDAQLAPPPLAYADPRRGTIFPSSAGSRSATSSHHSSSGSEESYDEEDELMMYRHGGGPMVIGWEAYGLTDEERLIDQRMREMSGHWGTDLITFGSVSSRSSTPNSPTHNVEMRDYRHTEGI